MKIIKTSNFIKMQQGHLNTYPTIKNPSDVGGSYDVLNKDDDGQDDIEKKWKSKKLKKTKVKDTYQKI